MSARLLKAWQSRGPLARALWPLSLLYRGLLGVRRLAYRYGVWPIHHLPVPVLVVGNVVVGGAGKTPTVVALVQHLKQSGWNPGVISRGYGRQGEACLEITPHTPVTLAGDEPSLIARATGVPLVVSRNRAAAGRQLLASHPQVNVIVCDDGMQHWGLARDLTVVMFDVRGTGNGWLLPAGLLREPWPAPAWGGGPMLVLHTAPYAPPLGPDVAAFRAVRQLSTQARNPQGECRALSPLITAPVGALAAIAQPQTFFDMLRAQGLTLQHTLALPDHAPGATLLAALQPGVLWLCTEKDAVKLFPLLAERPDLSVWSVALEQTPEPAFWTAIDRALLSSPHGLQTP